MKFYNGLSLVLNKFLSTQKAIEPFNLKKKKKIGSEMFSQDSRKKAKAETSGVNTKNCPY